MIYLDLMRIIVRDINRRKFSSFLTLFAISLGIFAIFMIIMLSIGFESSIQKQFDQLGSNRLYITSVTGNIMGTTHLTKGLTDSEVKLVENKPYVEKVYPYYYRPAQVKYGNEFKNSLLFGVTLDKKFFNDLNLEIQTGRSPKLNEKYNVVVGSDAAINTFSKDIAIGSNLYVKGVKFKVVGILKSVGNPQDDKNIYFNIDTLRELFGDKNQVGVMDVLIKKGYNINLASKNIKHALENRLGKDSISIVTPTQLLNQLSSILNIIEFTLGGIAFVALIVGALGIINTMFVIVTEKVKDIGIMKSVGATNTHIMFMFMFEAGVFGLLGAILGIIFGTFGGIIFQNVAHSAGFTFLEISMNPALIFSLLIFGFVIGVFSGFLPAYRASKLNIIEAIRK